MRPETAIALAMLALYKEREHEEIGFREDVIEKLKTLRANHIPVAGVRLRPGLSGEYSDEVSDFIGRLAIAGYVVQESPIRITPKGLKLLERQLSENADDSEVIRAARVLAIPLDRVQAAPSAGKEATTAC